MDITHRETHDSCEPSAPNFEHLLSEKIAQLLNEVLLERFYGRPLSCVRCACTSKQSRTSAATATLEMVRPKARRLMEPAPCVRRRQLMNARGLSRPLSCRVKLSLQSLLARQTSSQQTSNPLLDHSSSGNARASGKYNRGFARTARS
eukprot:6205834-Pleurochrysis_carterae.AAC.3